jgi:hypothetical protein
MQDNEQHQPLLSEPTTTQKQSQPEDCISCRIVGTAALATVGLYALQQSRAHAPGSVMGKRIVGGLGVCEHFLRLFFFFCSLHSIGLQASWLGVWYAGGVDTDGIHKFLRYSYPVLEMRMDIITFFGWICDNNEVTENTKITYQSSTFSNQRERMVRLPF